MNVKKHNTLGKKITRQIIQYDLQMNEIKHFISISEASRTLNIGKTTGGFIFKYLE